MGTVRWLHTFTLKRVNLASSAFAFLAYGFLSLPSAMAADVPQSFTLDGKLFSDAAGTTPLLDTTIGFKVQVLDQDQICVLYEEQQTINTATSLGYFSVQVGSAIGSPKRTAGDSANSMATVFQNISAVNGKLLSNGNACSAAATAGNRRFVRITIAPNSMGGGQRVLSPNLTIDSVPNAVVAERAETLQGLRGADVLKVNTTAGSVLSQSNIESLFTSVTRFNALSAVVDGTSTNYVQSSAGGAKLPVIAGAPTGPTQGSIWYDTTDDRLKYYDGSAPVLLGTGGGSVTSVGFTAPTELIVAGAPVTSSGTIAVTWAQQTTGKVFAAPNGSTGVPTFRALVAADAPFAVVNGGGTPSLQSGTDAAKGAAATAGRIWIATDTKLIYRDTGAVWEEISAAGGGGAPSGTAGGDLDGTYPNPSVDAIRGVAISAVAPLDGQVLKYSSGGTTWAAANFSIGDLKTAGGAAQFANATCDATQTLTWLSLTNTFTCASIAGLNASVITAGTIADARLPASATYWTSGDPGTINYSLGNVGIGSTVPATALDLNGAMTFRATAEPAAVAAQGKIYYDTVLNKFRVSQNGGAYTDLVGSGGSISGLTTNYLPKATSATTIGNSAIYESSGNVGIATTDLSFGLGWSGNMRRLVIAGDGTATNYSAGNIILANNRATATTGDIIGQLMFFSRNNGGAGAGSQTVGAIGVRLEGTSGTSGIGSNMTFSTRGKDDAFNQERMRIDSSGNVGIGTTTPSNTHGLTVHDDANSLLLISTTNAGSRGGLTLQGNATANSWQMVAQGSGNVLTFKPTQNINDATPATLTLSGSNVGIGQTSPNWKLDVTTNPWNITTGEYKTSNFYTFYNGGASTATYYGIYNLALADLNGGNVDNVTGTYSRAQYAAGPSTGNILRGAFNNATISGSGSVTEASATYSVVDHGSTGTVATAYGVYADVQRNAAGAITNAHGIYIDTLQGTNRWGVYQAGPLDNNYFAGNVGVGTTTPGARLDVADTGTTTSAIIVPRAGNFTGTNVNGMIRYNTASTLFEFYQNGAWVNYTTVSDGRLKTNVVPVTDALDIVNQLNPVFYDWDRSNPKASGFEDKHQVGFIAQEVEKVLPEVVNKGEDSYRSLEYGKIVSVVVAAVKELYAKVMGIEAHNADQDRDIASVNAKLEADNAAKDKKINHLEQENAAIKARLEKIEKALNSK